VFENRVLRGRFGPNGVEVKGVLRKLRDLYSSPSIIKIIKSRRMRWAGHVARIGKRGNPEGRRPLDDQDVGGWIILR
jgi:hypothetical protein